MKTYISLSTNNNNNNNNSVHYTYLLFYYLFIEFLACLYLLMFLNAVAFCHSNFVIY